MVSSKNILKTVLGPPGSLENLVLKQFVEFIKTLFGLFSIFWPTVRNEDVDDNFLGTRSGIDLTQLISMPIAQQLKKAPRNLTSTTLIKQ